MGGGGCPDPTDTHTHLFAQIQKPAIGTTAGLALVGTLEAEQGRIGSVCGASPRRGCWHRGGRLAAVTWHR